MNTPQALPSMTITIAPERCQAHTITVYAHSTVRLVTRAQDAHANMYTALLIDGRHYDLVLWKHIIGRPEIEAAIAQALAAVQAAIDALNDPGHAASPAPTAASPWRPDAPTSPAAPFAASPLPRMDALIAVALDGFAAEAQRLLDAELAQTPIDKDECRYFRAQCNAFTKALHYFSEGVRLTPTPSGYTVPSATRPGAVIHRLWRVGGIWHCSCEAGEKGIFHWHAALIAGYDRALDLIELEDDGDPEEPSAADILADAATERAAQAQARRALGQRIAAARRAYA